MTERSYSLRITIESRSREDVAVNAAIEQFNQFVVTNPGVSTERMNEIIATICTMAQPVEEPEIPVEELIIPPVGEPDSTIPEDGEPTEYIEVDKEFWESNDSSESDPETGVDSN